MKSLTQYINESVTKDVAKAIENFAWGVIDEFNQEGVVGFDENDWKDYVDGDKEAPFKEIVDEIIAQYEEYKGTRFGKVYDTPGGKKAITLLKDYDKNTKEINTIILNAAKNYLYEI